MKKILLVSVLAVICGSAAAQNFKFGHINAQELVALMPERDSAQVKFENYGKELQDQVEAMQVELNNKYNTFQQKQNTWSDAIKESKMREIQELGQRSQEFQQTAQEDLQKMYQTLLRPVIEKANKAIETVAKREGFTYVFDLSGGSLSYFNPEQSIDLLPLVKKELNITKVLPSTARPATGAAPKR